MTFDEVVEQHPLLREILETIKDGIVTIEDPNRFTYANSGAERLLGVDRSEIQGKELRESRWKLLSDEGTLLTGEEEPFTRAINGGTGFAAVRAEVLRPDLSRVPVLLNISPFATEGACRGVVGVFTDISEMEEIEQLKSDYQQTISHDLRNPLTAILGYSDLLERMLAGYDLPVEVRSALRSIQQAGRRMLTMLNDLMAVASIEIAGVPLECQEIPLNRFIPDLVERNYVREDLHRMEVALPQDLPGVSADPGKLGRVIENLLGNALAYSEDEIRIGAQQAGNFVRIWVSDRGKGVQPEQIPMLFERYRRAERRSGDGFGLGLFIVLLLTQAHGGHVYACSDPDSGMTFSVYFPVYQRP